ncbi:MAG: hypothetical protein IKO00_03605 [Oscillospiraceae bacterium]|nr:hypothetical protein [Oscillospiraceae bacterium]
MPGNFLNIDTEFPTLTGEESSKELVPELMNYLSLLVEQLRYTLNNLDTTNFNSKALSDWEADSTQDIVDQVVTLTALLNQTNQRLASLTSRVTSAEGNITSLEGRMGTAEENITGLTGRMTTAESNIGNLTERTVTLETWKTGAAEDLSGLRTDVNTNAASIAALQSGLSGLGSDVRTLISEMAQLKGAINVDASGNAVFGKAGKTTDIVGSTVRINGNPIT